MSFQLTSGICERIHNIKNDEEQEALTQTTPTLQVLSIKKVGPSTTAADRYRVIVSDGEHFLQAMLATQLNKFVEDDEVVKNSIIVIDKFTCNFVQDKRLLIILGMHPIHKATEKVGSPKALNNASEAATPTVQKPVSTTGTASTSTATQSHNASTSAPRQQQRNAKGQTIFPIESLSPYHNNWIIRARVTQKGDIRPYSNQKGEGKFFGVTFMDESGEIRGTAFNQAVDELYEKLQEGKVYYVSKAKVNLAKRKFSNVQNEYELSLERITEIEECRDGTAPSVRYNFVSLGDLQNIPKDTLCDVMGVVKEVGDSTELLSKFNKTVTKRELTIVDRTGFSVRLTLWGKQAEQFTQTDQPIVAWKGVKVTEFQGRSLSMISSSSMEVNPDIPTAHALRGWYDSAGNSQSFHAQSSGGFSQGPVTFDSSQIQLLNDVKESEMGTGDRAEFFSARATIMHIKNDNLAYAACQKENCNKKVIEQHDGWRCEKCDISFPKPSYRYILSMAVADCSGQAWLQGFNDAGQVVFGVPADELMELKDRDEEGFNKAVAKAIGYTFNFTCKAKQETFNERVRVRYGIQKILPLDYKEEAHNLKELLSSAWAQ
ncbi:replication factor-A protein 1 [Irpex rosettiformis]|uniref:Replication factor-A protein 1 n=1 Tax=Irpex rosettiformis TaxID=378272 RepID=A0ACB8UIJ8_9APHY|nr:replication factor-A protein 1 [Irpex rosettiformis]